MMMRIPNIYLGQKPINQKVTRGLSNARGLFIHAQDSGFPENVDVSEDSWEIDDATIQHGTFMGVSWTKHGGGANIHPVC